MNEAELAAGAVAASGGTTGAKAGMAFSAATISSWAAPAGGLFMFILTMAFAPPKTTKEVVLAFLSLLICGYCGSQFLIFYYGWQIPATMSGSAVQFGLAMPCAAIGWLAIKGWFKWSETAGVSDMAGLFQWIAEKLKK